MTPALAFIFSTLCLLPAINAQNVGSTVSFPNSTSVTATISITSAPSTVPSSIPTTTNTCTTCYIAGFDGQLLGQNSSNLLSIQMWYTSPITATIDTISYTATAYNNAVITSAITISGDVSTLDASHFSDLSSFINDMQISAANWGYYNQISSPGFVRGLTTTVDGGSGVSTFVYPDSFLSYNAIDYFLNGCQLDGIGNAPGHFIFAKATPLFLSQTYYINGGPVYTPGLVAAAGYINCPPGFYTANGGSQALQQVLGPDKLSSCQIIAGCYGPPSVKVPVIPATTTASDISTTTINSVYGSTLTVSTTSSFVSISSRTTSISVSPPSSSTPETSSNLVSSSSDAVTSRFSSILSSLAPTTVSEAGTSTSSLVSSRLTGESEGSTQTASLGNPGSSLGGDSGTLQTTISTSKGLGPEITIAGTTYTENSASVFVIGSVTVTPGGPGLLISGTSYSIEPSATALVIEGTTVTSTPEQSVLPKVVIGGTTYSENSASVFVIGSNTVTPGGSGFVISGTSYSIEPSETALVIGGTFTSTPKASSPEVVIGGTTYTENSASVFVIGSNTITPGGTGFVISGTSYSIASSATALVIGGTSTEEISVGTIVTIGTVGTAGTAGTSSGRETTALSSNPTSSTKSTSATEPYNGKAASMGIDMGLFIGGFLISILSFIC